MKDNSIQLDPTMLGIHKFLFLILIQFVQLDGLLGGLWEFPGGKIEPTEDPLGALKRELAEELQLNADNYQYLMTSDCVVNEVMIHLIAYQCQYISGATSSTDHDRIEWISGLELKDYTFTNPDIPIVQFIESQQVGF